MKNSSHNKQKLGAVRSLSKLLDSKFSLGPVKFGLDSLLGLIPGIGDSLGAVFSSFIIFKAWSLNVSGATMSRMILNTAIDGLIGAIPVVGDLFDIAWKANIRNLELLEREVHEPKSSMRRSYLWLLGVIIALGFIFYACIYLPLSFLASKCC
ncbi:MAG: hypothetical protein CME67_02295 [Halobacteriovoraceae bacterium]|nr:hypothetical protein [Halobacteriovoraceae bacterium]|tara:strand:+ start:923 stop:1381 length:459 start_codon:yes stop_codon:yes gene_type:complete